jgi:tRNA modification GTPase
MDVLYNSEPIAAIASGIGGAIAVIRISGTDCHQTLLNKCLRRKGPEQGPIWRKMELYDFVNPASGEVVDEPLCVFFPGPKSFTGEDMIEIHCHGGRFIVTTILDTLYSLGIKQAKGGEFTFRAFLNGKMDLAKAEGLRGLIEAESYHQWAAAKHLYGGKLSSLVQALRGEFLQAVALLEAQIDFPEEKDIEQLHRHQVYERVKGIEKTLRALVGTYDQGRVSRYGLKVCLLGEPNAGKSTLLNALLGRDRAIVTEIAGTTRDYIEETCLIKGRLIRLIDTAGIRETSDKVERIGVEASLRLAAEADILMLLCAADAAYGDIPELAGIDEAKILRILTKADLGSPAWAEGFLPVSCKTGTNLGALEDALAGRFDALARSDDENVFITSARHREILFQALANIENYYRSYDEELFDECLVFELKEGATALEEMIGRVDNDDIFDQIFSQFCIGK